MIALQQANYLGQLQAFKKVNGVIASVTTYPDTNYAECQHYHETLHMSFVLRGGNLEKREKKDVERLPGTVTFYDAGEPHRSTQVVAGSRHVNLEITDTFIKQHNLNPNATALSVQTKADAQFLLMKVYKELSLCDDDTQLGIETAVLSLLQFAGRKSNGQPAWVHRVKALLHDQWDAVVGLEELSAVAGLHPCNLSAWFPQYFGCTISEYRRKLKIEKALTMIGGGQSLTNIAYTCGFADQSHFTRVFKALTGWAPKPYEKVIQGRANAL